MRSYYDIYSPKRSVEKHFISAVITIFLHSFPIIRNTDYHFCGELGFFPGLDLLTLTSGCK